MVIDNRKQLILSYLTITTNYLFSSFLYHYTNDYCIKSYIQLSFSTPLPKI